MTSENEIMEWCDQCQRWHYVNSLTICKLQAVRRMMLDEPEPDASRLIAPERPWKRITDEN